MAYLLILGANSDIAKAVANEYARAGYDLYLAARKPENLEPVAKDLQIRHHIQAQTVGFDALDYGSHAAFYQQLEPKPLGVMCAFGYLGDQEKAKTDFEEARKIIDVNFTGSVSILNIAANDLEQRREGFIIGISSVAGDRGRQSNYYYGSAKAGFTAYLSGLRNRLFHAGVNVLTVKPGFVKTKMVEHMKTPGILTAQTEDTARDIFRAQQKGRNVLYTRWYWRIILGIFKSLPEPVFKRLKT